MIAVKSRTGPLIIAALLIAGLAIHAARSKVPATSPPTQVPQKPSKQNAANGRPDLDKRFPGLDPALKKTIHRLEAELEDWHRNRPPYVHPALHQKAFDDFTRGKIGELDIAQVASLAPALDKMDDVGGVFGYGDAIYHVWGSRDFAAARAHILEAAANGQPAWSKCATATPGSVDFNFENYKTAIFGHASLDPRGAWTAFLADKDDPAVNGRMKVRDIRADLFETYTAADPQEAWHLYLGEKDRDTRRCMFLGYLEKAPAGQDWISLAAEFDRVIAPDKDPSWLASSAFASRWMIEEPGQALDWFAANVDTEYLTRGPLLGHDAKSPDFPAQVKLLLLEGFFRSGECRVPETVSVLQHLASGADETLAARAIRQFMGSSMSPSESLPLLAVIPHFKSAQRREELFLEAARAVPAREYTEERYSIGMSFDHPNVCLEAVRELATQLELSGEVRAQADSALREVEAKEVEKQEARKRALGGR